MRTRIDLQPDNKLLQLGRYVRRCHRDPCRDRTHNAECVHLGEWMLTRGYLQLENTTALERRNAYELTVERPNAHISERIP